ncbi:unnamed protein product [Urochloa humidicola]
MTSGPTDELRGGSHPTTAATASWPELEEAKGRRLLRSVRPTCGARVSVSKTTARSRNLSRPIGKRTGLNRDPCGGIYKLLAASAAAAKAPDISRRGRKPYPPSSSPSSRALVVLPLEDEERRRTGHIPYPRSFAG